MKLQWVALTGTLIGGLLASWLGPKIIVWYSTPPVEYGVSCKGIMEWGFRNLQITQSVGMVVGLLLGVSLYFLLKGKKKSPDLTVE